MHGPSKRGCCSSQCIASPPLCCNSTCNDPRVRRVQAAQTTYIFVQLSLPGPSCQTKPANRKGQ